MDEIVAGDKLLEELGRATPRTSLAPTMGKLQKVAYTHEAMIELIIEGSKKPGGISQKEIAAHFNYTEGWVSNILASDAFQAALSKRRQEVVDPILAASVEERIRGLLLKSVKVLEAKLEAPVVSDTVALKAAEFGARALGLGGHGSQAPAAPSADRLTILAGRLVVLQQTVREKVVNGEEIGLPQTT